MRNIFLGAMFVLAFITASVRVAAPCNVCHSKNPKMVKMHEELRGKGCFHCHNFQSRKTPDETLKQRAPDPLCTTCHKK